MIYVLPSEAFYSSVICYFLQITLSRRHEAAQCVIGERLFTFFALDIPNKPYII